MLVLFGRSDPVSLKSIINMYCIRHYCIRVFYNENSDNYYVKFKLLVIKIRKCQNYTVFL